MSDDELENAEDAAAEAAEAANENLMPDAADELDELRQENADLKNRLLREMAEMENLRKRTMREKDDASRFAIAKFARDVLTVGDDLKRALDAVPASARESGGDAVATLLTGVEVTERQLQQIFERHGVRRFDPTGDKFDPAIHEAMFEMPDPSTPAGTVVQVVEAGYMIGTRVLRPARVGIAKGGPKAAAEPSGGADADAATGPETDDAHGADPGSEADAAGNGTADGQGGASGADGPGNVGGRIDRTA